MSLQTLFTGLADQVRRLSGRTGTLSLEEMTTALTGVELGGGQVDVSSADALPENVRSGKKFVGAAGAIESGTMPDAEQATPSISVSDDGLITASTEQSAGYVTAGTKSTTKQLTTKSATTVTPTNSVQTVVNAGTYCTGAITVAASTGKTMYSGTIAGNGAVGLTIDTGVTLADTDIFIMFPVGTESNVDQVNSVVARFSSTDVYRSYANPSTWHDAYGQEIGVVDGGKATLSGFLTYSGKEVKITSIIFHNSEYKWILLK